MEKTGENTFSHVLTREGVSELLPEIGKRTAGLGSPGNLEDDLLAELQVIENKSRMCGDTRGA